MDNIDFLVTEIANEAREAAIKAEQAVKVIHQIESELSAIRSELDEWRKRWQSVYDADGVSFGRWQP